MAPFGVPKAHGLGGMEYSHFCTRIICYAHLRTWEHAFSADFIVTFADGGS